MVYFYSAIITTDSDEILRADGVSEVDHKIVSRSDYQTVQKEIKENMVNDIRNKGWHTSSSEICFVAFNPL